MKPSTLFWMAIVLLLLTFGGCTASGNGWQVDNGVQYERTRQAGQTERTRIEANRDALLAESRERTTEAVAPWAAGSLIAFAIAAVLIAWSKRPHRPVPQHVLMLAAPELAQRPGARLEVVDGEWNVVDDARRELVPVGRRLTG